ncbi:MAG: hypothetical protein IKR18_06765 [Bacteroidaceae bacterium]|nr:hypothetical protein [Bacteroidaceae bacterium]
MKKLFYVMSLLLVLGVGGCSSDDGLQAPGKPTDTISQPCDSVLLIDFPFRVPYCPQNADSLPSFIIPHVVNDPWCYVLKGTLDGEAVYCEWCSNQGAYDFIRDKEGNVIYRNNEEECIYKVKDWTCIYSKYLGKEAIPVRDEPEDMVSLPCDSILLRFFPFKVPYCPQNVDSLPSYIIPYIGFNSWCYILKGTLDGHLVYHFWYGTCTVSTLGVFYDKEGHLIYRNRELDCIYRVKNWICIFSKYFGQDFPYVYE